MKSVLALPTGTISGTNPDWATAIGANSINSLSIPHLVLGGPNFSGEYGAYVVQTGGNNQLEELLDGSIQERNDHNMPLLSIHIIDPQLHRTIVPYQEYIAPNNRGWGENWRLAGLGYPVDTKKLEQYWQKHSTKIQKPERPFTIEFHLSKLDTQNPETSLISQRKLHSTMQLKPVSHDSSMEQ